MLSARLEESILKLIEEIELSHFHPLSTGPLSSWTMDPFVFNKHPAPIELMPWKEDEGEVEEVSVLIGRE